jgi:ABC-2 type transport system permease protein
VCHASLAPLSGSARGSRLSNVWSVFRREVAAYFGHPLAYVALFVYLGLLAAFTLWFDDVLAAGVADMRRVFTWMAAGFVFLVPAVTMRLVAEERRSGSLELLATLPLTTTEIVVGKWMAANALVLASILLSASWPIVLSRLGALDWGPVMAGYLGLLLLGGAFSAIGVFASSITDNQVVAFLVAATICLVPWVLGFALTLIPGDVVPLVQWLTFEYHFGNLARGVLDTRSLVFYGAVIAAALRLATHVLEHRRLA